MGVMNNLAFHQAEPDVGVGGGGLVRSRNDRLAISFLGVGDTVSRYKGTISGQGQGNDHGYPLSRQPKSLARETQ